jgi:hypothetical protein
LGVVHAIIALTFAILYAATFAAATGSSDEKNPLLPFPLYNHKKLVTTLGEYTLATLCVLFFVVSAVAHFWYAGNFRGKYISHVFSNGQMPYRWIEYGISATLMAAAIALASGVQDINAFVLLIIANIAMIATGAWFEASFSVAPTHVVAWAPLVIGFLLLAGIASVILMSFKATIDDVNHNNGTSRVDDDSDDDCTSSATTTATNKKIPGWIWAAIIVTLIFFGCFGAVPVIQTVLAKTLKSPPRFVTYEFVYMGLSAVAKISLGSLVAYGIVARYKAAVKNNA